MFTEGDGTTINNDNKRISNKKIAEIHSILQLLKSSKKN